MARLWLPEGLYLQELCDVERPTEGGRLRDFEGASRPFALHRFLPRERTVFVTCRAAEAFPLGLIVDRAFPTPGPGRVALFQVLEAGRYVLHCADYQVEILPVFRNLDVLSRAGRFMEAAIKLLKLEVPIAQSQNLAPLKAVLSWWKDPNQQLDPGADWRTIESWIRQEFEERDCRLASAVPACYASLDRELRFARDLAQATWRTVRVGVRHGGQAMAGGELVDDAIGDCILSAFRNSAEWSRRSIDEAPGAPNWFGFPLAHARNLVQRAFASLLGHGSAPQLPLKAARALREVLAAPATFGLEDAVATYVDRGDASVHPKVIQKCDRYFEDKRRFAISKFYLVLQMLPTVLNDSPTPDARHCALLGLLRAIDQSVWRTGEESSPEKALNRAGDFGKRAQKVIREHLVQAPAPKHPWDLSLLDSLQLQFPLDTEQIAAPEIDAAAPARSDPLRSVEYSDSLEALIEAASLTPLEKQAILFKYDIESVAPDLAAADLAAVQRGAFKKLCRVAKRSARDETDVF